MSQTFAPTRK